MYLAVEMGNDAGTCLFLAVGPATEWSILLCLYFASLHSFSSSLDYLKMASTNMSSEFPYSMYAHRPSQISSTANR